MRKETSKTEHQINESTIARWTKAVGILTGALVLTAVVSDVIFFKQWHAMQRQLDAMESDQRPWIKVDVTITALKINEAKDVAVSLKVRLKNFGKSPARNLQVVPEIHPVVAGPWTFGDAQIAACERAREVARKSKTSGLTVFPEETEPVPVGTTASGSEIGLHKDSATFVVFGCVDYTFGSTHAHGYTVFRLILGKPIDNGAHMAGIILQEGIVPPSDLLVEYDWTGGNWTE